MLGQDVIVRYVVEFALVGGAVVCCPEVLVPWFVVGDAFRNVEAFFVFRPGEFYAGLFGTQVVLIGLYAGEVSP